MNINFNNLERVGIVNTNKSEKINSKKSDVSFKGNDENQMQGIPNFTYGNVTIHPTTALNMELLKDGYTIEQINKSGIMFITEMTDIDFSDPQVVEDVYQGKITKDDIFVKTLKSARDVQAMRTAYVSLKEKFNTPDVREYLFMYNKLSEEMNAILSKKGKDIPVNDKYSEKDMILSVLYRVNSNNVNLMQELLNDDNFNNIHIGQALMSFDKGVHKRYPMQVLKMAQDIGYKKEFSLPLSILISEANHENIGIIEKMLGEQDFLAENEEFVSERLISLLRNAGSDLSLMYEYTDEMTLQDVKKLIDEHQSEE